MREREKVLREEARKHKRGRSNPYDSDTEDERGLVRDKRTRATAIVRGYLTRTQQSDVYKSLCLGGVLSIPAAMVDSTGLLGMALAFRAAAGELTMPDNTGEQESKSKPWEAIDTETPKSSAERVKRLKMQIELIEKEIRRHQADTGRRNMLTEEALQQRSAIDQQIVDDDKTARTNPFKKRKKAAPKPERASEESPGKESSNQKEEADDVEEDKKPPEKAAEDDKIDPGVIDIGEEIATGEENHSGVKEDEKMGEEVSNVVAAVADSEEAA